MNRTRTIQTPIGNLACLRSLSHYKIQRLAWRIVSSPTGGNSIIYMYTRRIRQSDTQVFNAVNINLSLVIRKHWNIATVTSEHNYFYVWYCSHNWHCNQSQTTDAHADKPLLHIYIYIAPLDMKRCICHFAKWLIHPFISKGTNGLLHNNIRHDASGPDICFSYHTPWFCLKLKYSQLFLTI